MWEQGMGSYRAALSEGPIKGVNREGKVLTQSEE